MKVLHVFYSRIYTGAEKVAAQIINGFNRTGEFQMAYCSPESESVRKMLESQGILYLPMEDLTPSELKRVIREYQPDVIHAHDMRASLVSALSCGKLPLVSHIHNNAYDARGLTVKSVGYLLAGFKAKQIIWVSRSAYEGYYFHKLFEKKSRVLYNIIDVNQIYEMRDSDPESYDFDVIFVGRLTYPKNPQRLMQISGKLVQKKPDVKIAVVGDGKLEEEAKALCAQLGIDKNVQFLGFRSNPIKMVNDSKLMILTSRWEGTPMCVLEAMALGTPVVSTPTDGMKDLVENGVNGYLSEDDDELVEQMLRILENPDHRRSLSENMRKMSDKINDMEQYQRTVASCYR